MTKLLYISSCYDCKYCEFGRVCRYKGVGYDGQFIKGAYIPYSMYPGRVVDPLNGIPDWCPLGDVSNVSWEVKRPKLDKKSKEEYKAEQSYLRR